MLLHQLEKFQKARRKLVVDANAMAQQTSFADVPEHNVPVIEHIQDSGSSLIIHEIINDDKDLSIKFTR